MGKIATRADCNTIVANSFTSNLTMCPTKTEVLATEKLMVNGNYANNQLVQINNIQKAERLLQYTIIFRVANGDGIKFFDFNADFTAYHDNTFVASEDFGFGFNLPPVPQQYTHHRIFTLTDSPDNWINDFFIDFRETSLNPSWPNNQYFERIEIEIFDKDKPITYVYDTLYWPEKTIWIHPFRDTEYEMRDINAEVYLTAFFPSVSP